MHEVNGKVVVLPGTVRTDRSFECARWWNEVELTPGTYDLVKSQPGTSMNWARIPGKTLRDNFSASLGAHTLPYDKFKNAGKDSSYSVMMYDHQLAKLPDATYIIGPDGHNYEGGLV